MVVERLRSELGVRADKVLACLRTATTLVALAEEDGSGLRLAESAAYNLREALNHVVEGRDPAEGGLPAVKAAWRRFKAQAALPDVDAAAVFGELALVLNQVESDASRASYYGRRLITYLEYRTGVSPLAQPGDPVVEFSDLRDETSAALHDELSLAELASLLARTIAWFSRMFTPPDEVTEAIRTLAAQRWSEQEQVVELRKLATNDHHLRLFFTEVTDPAWLKPLREAGVIQIPSGNALWPPAALLNRLGTTNPESVATLLEALLARTTTASKAERAASRFELLRVATHLGPAGYGVVSTVVRQHGDLPHVRSLGVHCAKSADASDPMVFDVADGVLNYFRDFRSDGYHAITVLDCLQAGATAGNVTERARMLAGKTRRLAQSEDIRYAVLGIEALTADLGEHPEPLLAFAHHLARILSKARRWDQPTSTQLQWLAKIPGEVGERLIAHVLAGASDVPVADKIAHVTVRLASMTATAEDLALVTDVLSSAPSTEDLMVWTEALGTPSPAPDRDNGQIPRDWARAWRWAALLPEDVITDWQVPIDYVSERHGAPDAQRLTGRRSSEWEVTWGESPFSVEELSVLPYMEAAALVAAWEPEADGGGRMYGHLEHARAFEEVVKADPIKWSTAPQDVATALGNPLYIEYYFRALTERAADIIPYAPVVLAAALTQWPSQDVPQTADQGTVDLTGNAGNIQEVVLDLAKALANKDSDLTATLNGLWERALAAVQSAPEADSGGQVTDHDFLGNAIGPPWGHGLQTMLALAAWEFRNCGSTRPEFERALSTVIETEGSIGRELRAILAAHRPLLEGIASGWLENQAAVLFREGALAQETFDLTVKWLDLHPGSSGSSRMNSSTRHYAESTTRAGFSPLPH